MPRKDEFILPDDLGMLSAADWDAKGKAAVRNPKPLAERYRQADVYTKGRKHQPVLLAQVHPDRWPLLTAHLIQHPNKPGYDGWPPSVARKYAARLKQMHEMQAEHGTLVLLRLDLSPLDDLPLYSVALAQAARSLIDELHAELLYSDTPYTLSVQQASHIHSHGIVPLAGLMAEHAELVQAARHGKGGGCLLLEGRAHGVVIASTDKDFKKVAGYTTRDPDARLDTPGDSDDYFDALEEFLRRQQDKGCKTARMAWKGSASHLPF